LTTNQRNALILGGALTFHITFGKMASEAPIVQPIVGVIH